MNKKAVSPVIAVMLLFAVAVTAVGAHYIWFKAFQAGSQKEIDIPKTVAPKIDTNLAVKHQEKIDAIKTTIKRLKSEEDNIERYSIEWKNGNELEIHLTYDYRENDPFKTLTKTMIEYADYVSYEENYYLAHADRGHYIMHIECGYILNEEDIAEILIDN